MLGQGNKTELQSFFSNGFSRSSNKLFSKALLESYCRNLKGQNKNIFPYVVYAEKGIVQLVILIVFHISPNLNKFEK